MESGPESLVKRRDPKRIKVRFGLRTRLLLAILAAVNVAFVLVWWISTRTAREGMVAQVDANLGLSAQNLADSVAELLGDSYADGLTSSRLDLAAQAIETGDPKNIAWYSDELVQQKGRYAAIVVADKSGKIVAANTVGADGKKLRESALGRSIAESEWAAPALRAARGTGVYVPPSRPAFLAGSGAEEAGVVGYSFPVFDILDERIGTLTVLVSIASIAAKLDGYVGVGDHPESAALVVDALGRAVAVPRSLGQGDAWRALQFGESETGHTSVTDPGGVEYFVVQRPVRGAVKDLGWRVAAMKTAEALEGPVDRISSRLLTAFLFAVLLTTVVLVFSADRVLTPIRELTAATRALGKASEFKPLPVKTHDEAGVLTASFNDLFLSLRDHEQGLEDKVAARTHDLALARADLADILDNMRQGIFTVDEQRRVGGEFSAFTRSLFEGETIAGRDVMELLQVSAQGDAAGETRMRFWLDNIHGSSELQWILSSEDGLREIRYRPANGRGDRAYQLEYAPVFKDGVVAKVMVIAKDITELRALEREMAIKDQVHKQNLARVAELAALDAELFATFLRETRELSRRVLVAVEALERDPQDRSRVDEAFRAAHTIKGNARIFHLSAVHDLAHALEDGLEAVRQGEGAPTAEQIADLGARANALGGELDVLDELGERVLFGARARGRGGPSVVVPERRVRDLATRWKRLSRSAAPKGAERELSELGEAIAALGRVELGEVFERLRKQALDLAKELGKPVRDLSLQGGEIELDSEVAAKLRDALVHALRNAIDHGIEPADERKSAGKPELGAVELSASESDGWITLRLRDDGAGIDVAGLKRRAAARRLRSAEELDALSDAAALELAFLPGLSTKELGSVSGRGVGMDVVQTVVKELGGKVSIESERGVGTSLTIALPASRARVALGLRAAEKEVGRVS